MSLTFSSTDVEIVSAAYQRWGEKCFAKLIGHWALSIWNPIYRSLILAKDPIGTRHLYYLIENDHVTWSTILEPLVQFAGKSFQLSEEYVASSFACLTKTHLTPYVGVHAVPPSSSVVIAPGKCVVSKYWEFQSGKQIRYRTDVEYEEHFRTVFAVAVRRALRSDRPVLAELSGGIDSSSIVCMADILIGRGESETQQLDTISYYSNSNPRFDELRYLVKVEEKRGRSGYHIDLDALAQTEQTATDLKDLVFDGFAINRFIATPDFNRVLPKKVFQCYAKYINLDGYRVMLSGGSGEDATGGYVPTPIPELQDLLVTARFIQLVRQLKAWARKMNRPRLDLLWEALRGFYGFSLMAPWAPKTSVPPWLEPSFIRRNKAALSWYPSKLKLFGGLPSFQHQLHLLNHKRRVLAYRNVWPELLCDVRYPYLDRDLLEFACAIPYDQMVGVGQRRFLMKRALAGIVPDDLLNRKRRATVGKKDAATSWVNVANANECFISEVLGIVDRTLLLEALEKARRGEEVHVNTLKRTLCLESWLGHLASHGVLKMPLGSQKAARSPLLSHGPSTTVGRESSAS